MSSPVKKVLRRGSQIVRQTSLAGHAARAVGRNTAAGRILDPAGGSIRNFEGGKDAKEIFDPDHVFHKTPDNSSIELPPTATDGAAEGNTARDRIRRRAYRAQGRASTIRSGAFGSYSGQPAGLLGG